MVEVQASKDGGGDIEVALTKPSSNKEVDPEKKKDEAEDNSDIPPPVAFSTLFKFAESKDVMVFVFGFVMSVLAAATLPSIMIVFGDIIGT